MYDSWKEELHNLLIFAGLFSAIVTAFTIEAGKTVQGDPGDMTVLLLQTIVLQINNLTNPQANLPITLNPGTIPSLYAQRINLLYSVSLTLSLVTVLGGIVCLQWLREFGKNITGVSHKEDLCMQYQRHEGLRVWGVMVILNMLPLFLLVALGLFFTGFVVSQWDSNSLASVPVTVLVVASGAFIFLTSVLPTSQVIWLSRKSSRTDDQSQAPDVLCPYRSPQSWLFHRSLQGIFCIINRLPLNTKFRWLKSLDSIHSWIDYDTTVANEWRVKAGHVESVYHALLWISREYRQTTMVGLEAYSCLIVASCYRSWMKLKERFVRMWEWKEQVLLHDFEVEININDTEMVRRIRAKAVIDATVEWHRWSSEPAPYSAILNLEESVSGMDRNTQTALLEDITTGLKNRENTWITEENAVAVACHVIHHDWWHWDEAIPILRELCKRPSTRSLRPIRHLCNKLRDKLRSKSKCDSLVFIFNAVFPCVDSAHLGDLAPILGRLLVRCEECFIPCSSAEPFLKIIDDLASQRLIAKERSLDYIFLYTKYVLERSYDLPLRRSSIAKTFNVILSAAEEHVRLTSSRYSFLHPDRFTIPRTICRSGWDSPDQLELVWALIDDFNKTLNVIWGIHENVETSGEGSRKLEGSRVHTGTSDAEYPHKERTSEVAANQSSRPHSTQDSPTTPNTKPLLSSSFPDSQPSEPEGLEDRETAGVPKEIHCSEEMPTIDTGVPISPLLPSSFQDSHPNLSDDNSTISIDSRAKVKIRLDQT